MPFEIYEEYFSNLLQFILFPIKIPKYKNRTLKIKINTVDKIMFILAILALRPVAKLFKDRSKMSFALERFLELF